MKKTFLFLLVFVLTLNICVIPIMANDISVMLNGKVISFDVPPQNINGRVMVPMRKIFEALNASVSWDGDTLTVIADDGVNKVSMQIGNTLIKVNEKEIVLDVAPQLIDGRTLVPVRAVAESFDAEVKWISDTQTVEIISKNKDYNSAVDLGEKKDFICLAGAHITYGIDDIWYCTQGTGYTPELHYVDKVYRWQPFFISFLYANITTDKDDMGRVDLTITVIKPDGSREVLVEDATIIDGYAPAEQIIKAPQDLEYILNDEDFLGEYTFVLESEDVLGKRVITNEIEITLEDYVYTPNSLGETEDFSEFLYGYGQNPDPDRIIDTIIWLEKNDMLGYPMIFSAALEMMVKNPHIAIAAIEAFRKEFGIEGTETLRYLDECYAEYMEILLKAEEGMSYVEMIESEHLLRDKGLALGSYFASGSYKAAKKYAELIYYEDLTQEEVYEYMLPNVRSMINYDPLFRAYCIYIVLYDEDFDDEARKFLADMLLEIL